MPTVSHDVATGGAEHELRETVRFQSKLREITLRDDAGRQYAANVLNESFGGIGISVDAMPMAEVGDELELTYNGVRMWAIVQNVHEEEGQFRCGLAWKAVGIANRARHICGPFQTTSTEDSSQRHFARFAEMLPGGLYMMWNLFEHAKWLELDEAADRLATSARRCGLVPLLAPVSELRQALRQGVRVAVLRRRIDDLIEQCLDVTRTATSQSG